MSDRMVLLPHPDGPTIATNSLWLTANERLRTAVNGGAPAVRPGKRRATSCNCSTWVLFAGTAWLSLGDCSYLNDQFVLSTVQT